MVLKKSSKSTRDGRASMKLKLSKRRSTLLEARFRRMVRVEVRRQVLKILPAVHSLARLISTSGSSLNQRESSGQRRLKLHFDCKLPDKLFTSDWIYADETQADSHVRVVLLDENNNIIKEGPLSSLKIEIFVVDGDFKADESEDWTEKELKRSVVTKRKGKSIPLLVERCVITMKNGVGSFNKIMFTDNSSWVPSKKFRLGAKVAEGVSVPVAVEISPAVSGAFRVKDQRGKSYEKRPVPLLDDPVWRLEKIKKNGLYHGKLEAERIRSVKDFLQKYYMDQSSLRQILGVKHKVWETIVQHATSCSLNGEQFCYDSEAGVKLLFNCVYKLIGVSFNHRQYQSLESLDENEKDQVEKLRHCAFEDQNKLVQVNFSAGWPSAKISPYMVPCPNPQDPVVPADKDQSVNNEVLVDCPSHPQTPLLDPYVVHRHQLEEPAAHGSATVEDTWPLLRSDSLLWDSITMPNFTEAENSMFRELASSFEPATLTTWNENGSMMASGSLVSSTGIISSNLDGEISKAFRFWCHAVGLRVVVSKFLIALRSYKTRR